MVGFGFGVVLSVVVGLVVVVAVSVVVIGSAIAGTVVAVAVCWLSVAGSVGLVVGHWLVAVVIVVVVVVVDVFVVGIVVLVVMSNRLLALLAMVCSSCRFVLASTTCMLKATGIFPLLPLLVGLNLRSGILHSGLLSDHWGHQQGPRVSFWDSVGARFRRYDLGRGSSSHRPPPLKTPVS